MSTPQPASELPRPSTTRAGALPWHQLLTAQRRRAGEPPIERSTLPWLGHAFKVAGDFSGTLRRLRAKKGDVVTLLIAGKRMHFILDPHDYASIFRERSRLQFHDIALDLSERMFGHPDLRQYPTSLDGFWSSTQHLKGEGLDETYANYCANLPKALEKRIPARGIEVDLRQFVHSVMFEATADALFGAGFADENTQTAFWEFDLGMPLFVSGFPDWLNRGSIRARQHLSTRIEAWFGRGGRFLQAREQALPKSWGPYARANVQIGALWASQGNSINGAYWALALGRSDESTWHGIERELAKSGIDNDYAELRSLRSLPLSHCVVMEALRLATSSMAIRVADQDFSLGLRSGNYRIRGGDNVCLWAEHTHRDERIFPEPERFMPTRFMPSDGKPPRFESEGHALPFAFIPFGGGESMCPGRFMAVAEIQRFIVEIAARYELKLRTQPQLDLDRRRSGLGVLPPHPKADPVRAWIAPK